MKLFKNYFIKKNDKVYYAIFFKSPNVIYRNKIYVTQVSDVKRSFFDTLVSFSNPKRIMSMSTNDIELLSPNFRTIINFHQTLPTKCYKKEYDNCIIVVTNNLKYITKTFNNIVNKHYKKHIQNIMYMNTRKTLLNQIKILQYKIQKISPFII